MMPYANILLRKLDRSGPENQEEMQNDLKIWKDANLISQKDYEFLLNRWNEKFGVSSDENNANPGTLSELNSVGAGYSNGPYSMPNKIEREKHFSVMNALRKLIS